jgi:hypothetical protein
MDVNACKGCRRLLVNHKKGKDALVDDDSAYYSTKSGRKPKRRNKGWRLLVEWKSGLPSWVPLTNMKDSYLIQIADYATANNLTNKPAFQWWVPFVLKKRARILRKVKTKYLSTTHKYGLELPKSVSHHALAFDKRTGTEFWKIAIEKEIRKFSRLLSFSMTKIPKPHQDSLLWKHTLYLTSKEWT